MAYSSFALGVSASIPKAELFLAPSSTSTSSTSFTASSANTFGLLQPLNCFQRTRTSNLTRGRRRSWIVGMAPEEEKMTRRSPLDFPIVSFFCLFLRELPSNSFLVCVCVCVCFPFSSNFISNFYYEIYMLIGNFSLFICRLIWS